MKQKNIFRLIFWILLIIICFLMGFHKLIFNSPYGIHFIRQTDSLSFASNYYNFHNGLFQPEVYNLTSEDGKAACEFPILYYFASWLYKLFGEKEIILRLINFLIFSIGLFSLFKTILLITKDKIIAYSIPFLMFSSGVVLYFSISFIPDTPALGFVLIGWYYFTKYYFSSKNVDLFFCFIFFLFAGLLKVTYLISPLTLFVVFIIEIYRSNVFKKKVFVNKKQFIIFFLSLIGIVFLWNYYAISYNNQFGDNYFLTHSRPIWKMSKDEILFVWDLVTNMWFPSYFYQTTIHVIFLMMVLGLILYNKNNRFIYFLTVIMIVGSIGYALLFFKQFADHDYYFIAFIPVIILILLNGFININNYFSKYKSRLILKYFFLVLTVLSLIHGHKKLEGRSKEKFSCNTDWISNNFVGINDYIQKIGIPKDAIFYVVGDHTKNGSLYFLKRKGYTSKEFSINFDYDYLVILKKDTKKLPKTINEIIGVYNNLVIYKKS